MCSQLARMFEHCEHCFLYNVTASFRTPPRARSTSTPTPTRACLGGHGRRSDLPPDVSFLNPPRRLDPADASPCLARFRIASAAGGCVDACPGGSSGRRLCHSPAATGGASPPRLGRRDHAFLPLCAVTVACTVVGRGGLGPEAGKVGDRLRLSGAAHGRGVCLGEGVPPLCVGTGPRDACERGSRSGHVWRSTALGRPRRGELAARHVEDSARRNSRSPGGR